MAVVAATCRDFLNDSPRCVYSAQVVTLSRMQRGTTKRTRHAHTTLYMSSNATTVLTFEELPKWHAMMCGILSAVKRLQRRGLLTRRERHCEERRGADSSKG